LPQVTLNPLGNIGRLETPYGRISKRGPITVPVDWALMRIGDENLVFTFVEEDRKDVLETSDKTLAMLSRVLKEDLKKASDLSSLLLPKKKVLKTPKITKSKKSKVVEEKSTATEE
tara:strand:+ start:353 stop:700 length:348 start_codon:yes stop_codon:yes gene_type:complete